MAPARTVTVTLAERTPKKGSVRFDATENDSALRTVYLSNDADTKLGSPESIKVTIAKA